MICPARPVSHHRTSLTLSPLPTKPERPTAYDQRFWLAYAANMLVMVIVALLFRYADFVVLTGGTEFHLGWIVGIGMVGSLAMRLAIGTGIDHFGPRMVWLGSIVLLAVTCFAHLAITSCTGPAVYLLRIAFCCAIAGVFGSSMTFISGRVPAARIAEMIGMLGSSGFLGIVLGTQLGDFLLGTETIQRWQVDRMFLAAGLLATCSLLFAYLATRGHAHLVPPQRHPPFAVLRRYHPGTVLLMGVASGIGLGLPGVFLRTYAAELNIPRIGLFFGVYATAAFVTRILTRRLPERFGTKPMILAGIGGMVCGQLLFLLVRAEWQLVIPAVIYGMSHAVMFPSVVAAGSSLFPRQHRGLAITLMLGSFDLGQLVGAPAAGAILHYSRPLGLPPYPTMFLSTAGLLAAMGVFYALGRSRGSTPQPQIPGPHEQRLPEFTDEVVAVGSGCQGEL